ncbi:hypothetical protein ACFVS2_20570 [Brevibacillus sp. NPDC058079]|uniref:hypothetical protein n=1 Tax=Brevibacillus sp. NPDC058079 TaxID=3346330 RepID=UPI0036E0D93E
MSKSAKVVLDYLMENTPFTAKGSFIDRIMEIEGAYETIPDEVIDAYEELSKYELWEIIRKVAVEGKRRNAV